MKHKSLRHHITLAVVLSFLAFAIVVASLDTYNSFELMKAESEEKLMNLVRIHAKKLDRDFVEKRIIGEQAQNYIEVTFDVDELRNNPDYLNEYEEEIKPYFYHLAEIYNTAYIYFNPELDGEGHDIWYLDLTFSGNPERVEEQDASYYEDETNKEWFFKPKYQGVPVWTNPYQTTILDDKSIHWISHTIPVYKDGLFIGVVGNDFLYGEFKKAFEEISVYGSGYGILLNDQYGTIIHPDFDEVVDFGSIYNNRYQWITEEMASHESGFLEYTWEDGDTKVLAYSRLDNGWVIGITASKAVIFAALFKQIQFMSIVITIGILIAAYLIYNLMLRMTQRLENVTQVISDTGRGDYESPIPGHYLEDDSEIGVLARAVEDMRIQQKKSFAEIQRYSDSLQLLVDQRTQQLENANHELEVSLAELRNTQRHLIESQKFEAINRFLVEIAHRMNTPLGNANMTVSYMNNIIDDLTHKASEPIAESFYEEMRTLKDSVIIASKGIQSSTEIIKSLQALSKDLTGDIADQINMKEIIEVSFTEFRARLNDKNRLELQLECPDILKLETYPVLLMEAFTNLFKYTVMYSAKEQLKMHIDLHVSQKEQWIQMEYHDHSDLAYDDLEGRIFEPFSIASFDSGTGGMEMHMLFNIVTIGLKGKIQCMKGNLGEPYYIINIPT